MGGGSLGSIVGGKEGGRTHVLVLDECILNAPAVSLLLLAFDDTGSLGNTPRLVLYPSPGSTLGDCLLFP